MATPQAPPSSRFPVYPASWYLVCPARGLAAGPRSVDLAGRRLVAFRSGGRVAVLDARCSHLGADLGKGTVVGDRLRCPFHGWEYGADGRCAHLPGSPGPIPAFACQTPYPAAEQAGLVFAWNGPQPLFPLPFFAGLAPAELAAGRPFRFVAECPWYMIAANGFDARHLGAVHDRELLGEQEVDAPAPPALRVRYRVAVTGRCARDRALRRVAGPEAAVAITVWGGSLVFVEARFARAVSRILFAVRPVERSRTEVLVLPFARRARGRLGRALLPLDLAVRHWSTAAFVRGDLERLDGVRYNPATLVPGDRSLIQYFRWIATLPGSARQPEPAMAAPPVPQPTFQVHEEGSP